MISHAALALIEQIHADAEERRRGLVTDVEGGA